MKYLKVYESFLPREKHFKNLCWYNAKLNDILPESDIYQYVEQLHDNEDFIDGDISDRIESFSEYQLKEIDISDIDIDEFYLNQYKVDEFKEEYQKIGDYPPIVLEDNLRIIDGTHRVNALNELGVKKVKAWIGIKSN